MLILTLNEEQNIGACLESVAWCDDIVVLDSMSTDRTTKIALESNARVLARVFDNWAAHQNWAVSNIEFRNAWVFYLDADERMTPELARELEEIAKDVTQRKVAFYCGRKNFFMGRWIRHAMPPGQIMRFFRPESVRFERLVNPVPIIRGEHGYLKNHFLHYNFSKGLSEWFDKHNKYSSLEAIEGMRFFYRKSSADSLFSSDPATQRRALKNLSVRLPLRPLLKFLYLYFIKCGFLDGRPGFRFCALQSVYEFLIVLKMKEMRLRQQGLGL